MIPTNTTLGLKLCTIILFDTWYCTTTTVLLSTCNGKKNVGPKANPSLPITARSEYHNGRDSRYHKEAKGAGFISSFGLSPACCLACGILYRMVYSCGIYFRGRCFSRVEIHLPAFSVRIGPWAGLLDCYKQESRQTEKLAQPTSCLAF